MSAVLLPSHEPARPPYRDLGSIGSAFVLNFKEFGAALVNSLNEINELRLREDKSISNKANDREIGGIAAHHFAVKRLGVHDLKAQLTIAILADVVFLGHVSNTIGAMVCLTKSTSETFGLLGCTSIMAKLSKKKLEKLIEQIYYVRARGKQINIMDIGKVFKAGEDAYTVACDLHAVEVAVIGAIAQYCEPSV